MSEAASFTECYADALAAHARDPSEQGRAQAYALGREAVHSSMSLLALAIVHEQAMQTVLGDGPPDVAARWAATEFYLEALSTFDMTQRGYLEAQERARAEREHADRLARLNDAVVAVASVEGHRERLLVMLSESRNLLSARRSAVFVGSEEAAEPQAPAGALDEARPLARAVRTNGLTLVEQTGTGGDAGVGEWVLAAPIGEPGQHPRGALLVFRDEPFGKEEVAIGEQFARYASLALAMAARLEQEHDVAIALQNALLPPAPPIVPGLEVAWRYLAAEAHDIGGDWYDVFNLDNGEVVLVIGDVMGHDLRAAAIMGQLRLAVQAYAVEGHSPSEVIERADRLLQRIDPGGLATLAYVLIDTDRRRITLSNAGHPSPLLVAPGGELEILSGGVSVPLGIEATSARRREALYSIDARSVLLLYTDGLVEDRAHNIEESVQRLIDAVHDGAGTPDELCEKALSVRPTVQRDDICVLCAVVV